MSLWFLSLALAALAGASPLSSTLEFKGVPDDPSEAAANTEALNEALASLSPGGTLSIPNSTFWLSGGVYASDLQNATIQLDGTLMFSKGRNSWPTEDCVQHGTCVKKAILLENVRGLTLTSSAPGGGMVDGNGESWWGYVNYLIHSEDRPKLLTIQNATDILVEDWNFRQAAYHTFHADDVARLEVRRCTIDNRVNSKDNHNPINLRALNTDGFDFSGKDIYIHDCSVWNQDDCFTVVPTTSAGINAQCTENVLIENVEASGLGLTVGSIKPTSNHACIKNITFRNAYMKNTYKGIYIKASAANEDPDASAEITNILYENITMDEPEQVPIWIGPAQEGDSNNACSLLWPAVPFTKCPAPLATVAWTNITLRDIIVRGAKESPGLIFGSEDVPMEGVVFDNVVFDPPNEKARPWKEDFYYCKGVNGIARGGTTPVPPCFEEEA
ncbi:hypothetical protein TeGR_g13234 [Tetraparma gracilis]|uniref:Uncharacterized protein n=1 Tax=Tetraparma gracilis TaxID=2962635 RepID=A0ABQ6MWR5_9STRA|nr:hypothetical protein TeGR_g13234 [Tetraparma gracilis]